MRISAVVACGRPWWPSHLGEATSAMVASALCHDGLDGFQAFAIWHSHSRIAAMQITESL